MKKTFNINLGGLPFIIDEDAYNLLKDYLDTIRYAFKTDDDTEELAKDIENRIAEILYEKDPEGIRIVSFSEISKVIERIGKPNEIIDIDETIEDKSSCHKEDITVEETITPPPHDSQSRYSRNPFVRKKIFRDTQNGMLGGVCAGLAHYLNIDVTIVRLIMVLLLFLSVSTVGIIYIILWIVVPDANTPYQRMQMMGKNFTMENIGKSVTENYQDNCNSTNNNNSGKGGFLSTLFSIFIKCCVILCFILGLPILLVLLFILVVCIITFFAVGVALVGGSVFGDVMPFDQPGGGVLAFYLLLASIGAIITIGIPIYLLIRMIFKKSSNLSDNNRRSMLVIWLIGIALTAVFTVKTVKKTKQLNFEVFNDRIEKFEEIAKSNEFKDVENIKVKNGEIIMTDKENNTITISKTGVNYNPAEKSVIDSIVITATDSNINTDSISNAVITDTIE